MNPSIHQNYNLTKITSMTFVASKIENCCSSFNKLIGKLLIFLSKFVNSLFIIETYSCMKSFPSQIGKKIKNVFKNEFCHYLSLDLQFWKAFTKLIFLTCTWFHVKRYGISMC
jgi:hypothetical protein